MSTAESPEWERIARELSEPFNPEDVDFRIQGKASANSKVQMLAYIDARTVQDRLDAVVGCGNWAFDWTPAVVDKGEVQVAKGTLTIYGVSKSDAGSASTFAESLGAVSHCFKRAAVQWGIGRYLYDLEKSWVPTDANGRVSAQTMETLRKKLPRPGSAPRAPIPIRPDVTPTAPAEAPAAPAEHPQHVPAGREWLYCYDLSHAMGWVKTESDWAAAVGKHGSPDAMEMALLAKINGDSALRRKFREWSATHPKPTAQDHAGEESQEPEPELEQSEQPEQPMSQMEMHAWEGLFKRHADLGGDQESWDGILRTAKGNLQLATSMVNTKEEFNLQTAPQFAGSRGNH